MAYSFSLGLDRRIDALLPASPQRPTQARPEARRAQLATPAPPPPAVRPNQPAVAVMAARAQRRQTERTAPGREGQSQREREHIGDTSEGRDHGVPVSPRGQRDQGQRGQDDNQETSFASAVAGDAGAHEELDAALIAALLAQSHDSGMFEVLLPGGDTLGVAVDVRPEAVDYLLTPASERVATHLRGRQMELAGQLGQRIGRSVRVTVL